MKPPRKIAAFLPATVKPGLHSQHSKAKAASTEQDEAEIVVVSDGADENDSSSKLQSVVQKVRYTPRACLLAVALSQVNDHVLSGVGVLWKM